MEPLCSLELLLSIYVLALEKFELQNFLGSFFLAMRLIDDLPYFPKVKTLFKEKEKKLINQVLMLKVKKLFGFGQNVLPVEDFNPIPPANECTEEPELFSSQCDFDSNKFIDLFDNPDLLAEFMFSFDPSLSSEQDKDRFKTSTAKEYRFDPLRKAFCLAIPYILKLISQIKMDVRSQSVNFEEHVRETYDHFDYVENNLFHELVISLRESISNNVDSKIIQHNLASEESLASQYVTKEDFLEFRSEILEPYLKPSLEVQRPKLQLKPLNRLILTFNHLRLRCYQKKKLGLVLTSMQLELILKRTKF